MYVELIIPLVRDTYNTTIRYRYDKHFRFLSP